MATVTGLTAAKALELAAQDIIDGDVSGDDLLLTRRNGTQFIAGNIRGPQGIPGTLSIAEKPPADLPSTYPANSVSVFDFASTAGWPTTFATVLTVNEGTSRIFQIVTSKVDDDMWFRTGASDVWGAFKKIASKTYVDAQTAATLASANSYADGKVATVSIGNAIDLNTLKTPGNYIQAVDSQAAAGTNYPDPTAGVLAVFGNGTTQVYQEYRALVYAGDRFFRRTYNGTTWSAWKTYYAAFASMPAATTTAANGTETSGTTETRDAVLGNYSFTALAGHSYRVVLENAGGVCTVVNDQFGIRIRNGGASTPTASSTQIANTRLACWNNSIALPLFISGKFSPGAGVQTLSVFCIRLAGTGTMHMWAGDFARALYVIDLGV
jgi:hypothetical protein